MSELTGKVAVVTGASKGIGAAIARALGAAGAAVVVNYASSRSGAEAVVADIARAGGRAVAVRGDVSKAEDAKSIIDAAVQKFGRLDVLVNNSGVYEFAPIEVFTEEQFHRTFNINVLGLLLTTQAAVGRLGEGASIINIGSGVTRVTPPNSAVYTGTKGAVDAITGVLARELGPRKIRVNSINPGMIETEGTHTAGFIGSDFEKAWWRRPLWAGSDNRTISRPLPSSWPRMILDGSLENNCWPLGGCDNQKESKGKSRSSRSRTQRDAACGFADEGTILVRIPHGDRPLRPRSSKRRTGKVRTLHSWLRWCSELRRARRRPDSFQRRQGE